MNARRNVKDRVRYVISDEEDNVDDDDADLDAPRHRSKKRIVDASDDDYDFNEDNKLQSK